MAKPKLQGDPLAKRPDENHAQWQMRLALAGVVSGKKTDRQEPNELAKLHGDYSSRFVFHHETATLAKAHINRGGTPVARWERDKKLSETQLRAIAHMTRLWEASGLKQRLTANYGDRIMGSACVELRSAAEIDARHDLKRIEGYIPRAYFQVFENVCRHDMPAGVAGELSGHGSKGNEARAHTIVCFVADIIAMQERLT